VTASGLDGSFPGRDAFVAALVARDPRALAALYDACAARAYGLALRILRDEHAAADAVHDAFLWLWEHIDRFDAARGAPEALLLTIVHRRAVDAARSRRNGRASLAAEPVDESALVELARIDASDLHEAVRRAVRDLPADQRVALELAYFRGFAAREIAEALHIPEGTVRSRLRLALAKVRAALGVEVER
jgi:RNA polymerase sigma-70 factor, ECF subfamily